MSLLLCSCHLHYEKNLSGAQQESRNRQSLARKERVQSTAKQKRDDAETCICRTSQPVNRQKHCIHYDKGPLSESTDKTGGRTVKKQETRNRRMDTEEKIQKRNRRTDKQETEA